MSTSLGPASPDKPQQRHRGARSLAETLEKEQVHIHVQWTLPSLMGSVVAKDGIAESCLPADGTSPP